MVYSKIFLRNLTQKKCISMNHEDSYFSKSLEVFTNKFGNTKNLPHLNKIGNSKNLPPFNLAFDYLTVQLHDDIRITSPLRQHKNCNRKTKQLLNENIKYRDNRTENYLSRKKSQLNLNTNCLKVQPTHGSMAGRLKPFCNFTNNWPSYISRTNDLQ